MLEAPERARADVLLRSDRIYYRFATESQVEDGDLPGLGDRMASTGERLLDAVHGREGETPIDPAELRVSVFVDNLVRPVGPTEQSLRRLAQALERESPEFAFLNNFCV